MKRTQIQENERITTLSTIPVKGRDLEEYIDWINDAEDLIERGKLPGVFPKHVSIYV